MKVFFRDDQGKFLSRKDYAATGAKVVITYCDTNYSSAEQTLDNFKSIDIEKIAAICAAANSVYRKEVDSTVTLKLHKDGRLDVSGPIELLDVSKHALFSEVIDLLNERINEQSKFVEFINSTQGEV